jgi:hypothetical protein
MLTGPPLSQAKTVFQSVSMIGTNPDYTYRMLLSKISDKIMMKDDHESPAGAASIFRQKKVRQTGKIKGSRYIRSSGPCMGKCISRMFFAEYRAMPRRIP